MPAGNCAVRVPEQLRVIVRVQIDKARRHYQSIRVNHLVRVHSVDMTDVCYNAIFYADIALIARQSSTINDHAVLDDAIVASHDRNPLISKICTKIRINTLASQYGFACKVSF